MTYTRHGHHILGTTLSNEGARPRVARCGGPALCTVCQQDVAKQYAHPTLGDDLVTVSSVIPEGPYEDTSGYELENDRYLKAAKLFVIGARNNTIGNDDIPLSIDDLYIVWFSKTLDNWKALVSTSVPGDGLYFEVTHNGAKNETYVDTYVKVSNDVFGPEG